MLQPGKESEFDDLSRDRVLALQLCQSVIQRNKILAMGIQTDFDLLEFDAATVAAPFEPFLVPSPIDDNAAHRLRGGGKEVPPAIPLLSFPPIDKAQIGFVDQRGCLQRVSRSLLRHLFRRESAKFVVNQGQELRTRLGIPRANSIQELSHL